MIILFLVRLFLEEIYKDIKEKVENLGIKISNIEHNQWMERYTFVRNKEIAVIDFSYNKRGQVTSINPNARSNSQLLIQNILGSL